MPYAMVFSKAEVQQHKREDAWYVEYHQAIHALNKKLDCAGDGFVSCEGYEAVIDMVKVKQKHRTRRNVEACFHMQTAVFCFFLS